jgi:uncharacterized membrane protein (UPF0127 family)
LGEFIKRAEVKYRGGVILARCLVTEYPWERMTGLLPRASLAEDEALFIEPGTSVHTFFMRFRMDAAFLDSRGRVLALYDSLPPWRHTWIHWRAAGVLETAGGVLARHGVRKGDVLEICRSS